MIDPDRITRNVVSKLSDIGINPEYNGVPSHTSNLVYLIVKAIVDEITTYGEVNTVVNTKGISSSPGSLEVHNGKGYGRPGSIK